MSYNKTKNASQETEKLSADDEKLHQMLGGLKKVNSPKNFDFQLKARIAKTKPRDLRRPVLLPILRYALPLSVIVLLAGFLFFNLSLSTGNQNAPVVADITPKIQNEAVPLNEFAEPSIGESLAISTNTNRNSEGKTNAPEIVSLPKKNIQEKPKFVAEKNLPPVDKSEKAANNSKNNDGGSLDRTLKDAPVILEINKNPTSSNSKQTSIGQFKLSLREILSGIGVEADYVGNGWKILSIKDNSIAMRSSMKVGDVIESVDGRKLSSDTAFLKSFSAKIFRILRNGEQVLIDITAK